MRKFTDKELELAPKIAEVIGGVWDEPYKHEWPLEHDCLEWLRERYDVLHIHYSSELGERIWDIDTYSDYSESPTLLETLYRVIIEIGGQDA